MTGDGNDVVTHSRQRSRSPFGLFNLVGDEPKGDPAQGEQGTTTVSHYSTVTRGRTRTPAVDSAGGSQIGMEM